MNVTVVMPARDEAKNNARHHCARVHYQRPDGKGGAIVEAGHLVTDEIIIFIDADQSHDPTDIPRLVEPVAAGAADMVIGSRMLGGGDELFTGIREFTRLLGGHVLTLLIAKRFPYPLTDSQNGFRAIRADVLAKLPLKQRSFTIETEMCIEALRHGYRVLEVQSHEYRRARGVSSIDPLKLGSLDVAVCVRGVARRSLKTRAQVSAGARERFTPRWRSS